MVRAIATPPRCSMSEHTLLLAAVALAVAFIVVATTRWKMHPFLALLLAALAVGLGAGLSPAQTLAAISGGFGRTVGAIGVVIACGCIIGTALEKSGCAQVMAAWVLRLTGERRAVLAMAGTGALVSISVFCDSGFVILSSLAKSLARRTGESFAAFAVALAMGLYATHCMVPPTPGPIAAAGALGASLGRVIGLGLLVSLPVVATTYLYARWIGRRVPLMPASEADDAAVANAHSRPGTAAAFFPIILPVALIALKSWADAPGQPAGVGTAKAVLSFLGEPALALLLGVFGAWWVVRRYGAAAFGGWTSDGVKDAGTIILITAAGGAFGGVLRETPLGLLVGARLGLLELGAFNLVVPFVIAAGLKTAQGSSTVAMITTAGVIAPLLGGLGLAHGYGPVLATLAVAGGAMMVSHVNDSFFWVITQLSGMTVAQGYRTVTVASGIAGLTALAAVLVLAVWLN
jgi:GntP family gluconate:H+ symporter